MSNPYELERLMSMNEKEMHGIQRPQSQTKKNKEEPHLHGMEKDTNILFMDNGHIVPLYQKNH